MAAISKEEVAGKSSRELSDDEVIAVLSTEMKKRREAAQAYTDAGRPDMAVKETTEASVIERYLPQQLTEGEVDGLIAAAVAESAAAGLAGGRAMGAVMKTLKPKTAGRVDGASLATKVKQALGM